MSFEKNELNTNKMPSVFVYTKQELPVTAIWSQVTSSRMSNTLPCQHTRQPHFIQLQGEASETVLGLTRDTVEAHVRV